MGTSVIFLFLVSDSAGILAKLPAALPFLPVLLVVKKCTFFCVLDTIKKNPFPRKLLFAEAVKQYFFSPAQRDAAAAATQQLISAFFASDGSLFNGRGLPQKKKKNGKENQLKIQTISTQSIFQEGIDGFLHIVFSLQFS